MCLAIPAKITEVEGDFAVVDYGGVNKKVNIRFTENVSVGDFVLIHAGFAIEKMDMKKARETIELLNEMVGND